MGPMAIDSASTAFKQDQTAFFGPPAFPLIFGGLHNDAWAGIPLPIDLTPYGAPGCSVYISLEWIWPIEHIDRTFIASSLDLPNDASLLRQVVYVQGAVFAHGGNLLGVSMSNAYQATIGPARNFEYAEVPEVWWAPNFGQRFPGEIPIFRMTVQ
jgi:hypothetical protein